jgi:type II secretory pathway component GspD/PulD (secretin)
MSLHSHANARPAKAAAILGVVLAVATMLLSPHAGAQTSPQETTPSNAGPAVPQQPAGETVQTFFLTSSPDSQDFNGIQTALRNVLPKAKIYGIETKDAITVKATPEDMEIALKLVTDLDKPRNLYRVTYTITDIDGGKRLGSERFILLVRSGSRSMFKQGSRVPIVTGNFDGQAQHTEVQYQDIGLSIQAEVNGSPDTISLRTKIEQSSLADERGVASAQDPVVRQNVLDGMSQLSPGKPQVLGSLDVPGTTRSQEIEVLAELVR